MADEQNTDQVVNLALLPVRGFPERRDRRYLWELSGLAVLPARQHQFEHEPVLVRDAGKVIDNFQVRLEARLRGFFRVRLQVVDATNTIEHLETQPWIVAEEAADFQQVGGIDDDVRVDGVELLGLDLGTELLFDDLNDFG